MISRLAACTTARLEYCSRDPLHETLKLRNHGNCVNNLRRSLCHNAT